MGKIKARHPTWKLQQRRVKKFVKRHLNKDTDPAGADDDVSITSVPSFQSNNERMSSKSLLRMYSKEKAVVIPEDAQEEKKETFNGSVENDEIDQTEKDNSDNKETQGIKNKDSKQNSCPYDTDLDELESDNEDCWAKCSIM